ncbi:hypothetical protein BZG36_00306 [Bifiguratus adelaidae]|uniref:RRM domain-containing protein n=1 Tax=Bifiguratus adelaidae TaxID=1938954 RepID=A0A261Y7V1_9FUNG|nr:hypothetical protein BZG36_00306 [Bifiguratus adelaidae]
MQQPTQAQMQQHQQNPPNDPTKTVYVGNLDPRVTDLMLQELFSTAGVVESVKVIPDKALKRPGQYFHTPINYGFVEFTEARGAEQALSTLNGKKLFNHDIRVNWASASQKEDTSNHFHIFVGDLSPEVNNDVLAKAFASFKSMSDAHVMWDVHSGKSRGFGFVAFREKADAEQAIATMNGEWLGSRAIRCNWATQKNHGGGMAGQVPIMAPGQVLPYEAVVQQMPQYITTVYIGNIPPQTTQQDLLTLFQSLGYVHEIRLQADRGFAFVKMDTHENAAMAIVTLQGVPIHGRPAKLSWGKDRTPEGWQMQAAVGAHPFPAFAFGAAHQGMPHQAHHQMWTPQQAGHIPHAQAHPHQHQVAPHQHHLPQFTHMVGAPRAGNPNNFGP